MFEVLIYHAKILFDAGIINPDLAVSGDYEQRHAISCKPQKK
jgi:hypothetical protein